jgi:methylase of polypeptide subunit release factors
VDLVVFFSASCTLVKVVDCDSDVAQFSSSDVERSAWPQTDRRRLQSSGRRRRVVGMRPLVPLLIPMIAFGFRGLTPSWPSSFALLAGGDDVEEDRNTNRGDQQSIRRGGRSGQSPTTTMVDWRDTSAATRISASMPAAMENLSRVGQPYPPSPRSSNDDRVLRATDADRGRCWEGDIARLRDVLDGSRYRHATIRERVFDMPPGRPCDAFEEDGKGRFVGMGLHEEDYPMGPVYVRSLVAGQGFDVSRSIDRSTGTKDDNDEWLGSLRCLAALFLLASCVPRHIFVEHVVGGDETLELMLRLGIVFVSENLDDCSSVQRREIVNSEWVVPLVHLFPLEIPPIRSPSSPGDGRNADNENSKNRRNIVLMTDLHPTVLGTTSLNRLRDENDDSVTTDEMGDGEGAVMYIGPDSLALIHHLHGSVSNMIKSRFSATGPPYGRILDVCTGSGVQALAAIAMLESLEGGLTSEEPLAVAVDVNHRALQFTTFNAHLNGLQNKLVTVHADLLVEQSRAKFEALTEELLNAMRNCDSQHHHVQLNPHIDERKFDFVLANPPFIPVPPSRLDYSTSSLRVEGSDSDGNSAPRYGLFSSGGVSGEDCLRAIVQMAPSLLRSDGGLLAVVSEFMNPPLPSSKVTRSTSGEVGLGPLTARLETWWGSQLSANGIVFTNENPINADIYAQRRAVRNDLADINIWNSHLNLHGIVSVSPGLLFVQTIDRDCLPSESRHSFALKHHFVPKSERGSIWTPHNVDAVQFTRDILMGLFASCST